MFCIKKITDVGPEPTAITTNENIEHENGNLLSNQFYP